MYRRYSNRKDPSFSYFLLDLYLYKVVCFDIERYFDLLQIKEFVIDFNSLQL